MPGRRVSVSGEIRLRPGGAGGGRPARSSRVGPDRVSCLHPHQTTWCGRRARDVHLVPEGAFSPRRAVLAANMETALNVVWDAGVGPGDKVLVVGGGVLGLLIAGLCRAHRQERQPSLLWTSFPNAPRRLRKPWGRASRVPDEAPAEQERGHPPQRQRRPVCACALEGGGVEAKVVGSQLVRR